MEERNYLHGRHRQKLPQHQYSGYHRPQNHQGWREEEGIQPNRHTPLAQRESPQRQNAQALPPGWVEATDSNSGKIYYCNPQTWETKWERPTTTFTNTIVPATAAPQSKSSLVTTGDLSSHYQRQQQQKGPLPPGWVEALDQSSGKIYYCNPQTRETKWEHPGSIPSIPSTSSTKRAQSNGYNDAYGNVSNDKGEHSNGHSGIFMNTNIAHRQSNQKISPSLVAMTTLPNNDSDKVDFDELGSLTGGQIAHFIKLQQRQECEIEKIEIDIKAKKKASTYVPLHISSFSSISTTERTEPGRLDVRMYALRGELKKFGYTQGSTRQPHPMK